MAHLEHAPPIMQHLGKNSAAQHCAMTVLVATAVPLCIAHAAPTRMTSSYEDNIMRRDYNVETASA